MKSSFAGAIGLVGRGRDRRYRCLIRYPSEMRGASLNPEMQRHCSALVSGSQIRPSQKTPPFIRGAVNWEGKRGGAGGQVEDDCKNPKTKGPSHNGNPKKEAGPIRDVGLATLETKPSNGRAASSTR